MNQVSNAATDRSTQIARDALREILTIRERHGAPLKVALIKHLRDRGVDPFAYFRSFPKFSAFLTANSDLVEVISTGEPGDIIVRLREHQPPTAMGRSLVHRIRGDVWKAFTNPDPVRRRFFDKLTGDLSHYQESLAHFNDRAAKERTKSSSSYVEVDYAKAETQTAWMRDFLASATGLPDHSRQSADHLTQLPYDSSLDMAFAGVLGSQFGEAWRQYRAGKILNLIQEWAERREVPFERLLRGERVAPTAPVTVAAPAVTASAPLATPLVTDAAATQSIRALLEQCTDEELEGILLPASAVIRILRTRQ